MRMAPWVAAKRPRLLIVDDNAQNVELLTALMQAEGCEVVSAVDGLEAVAQEVARLLREEVERGWRQRNWWKASSGWWRVVACLRSPRLSRNAQK